MKPEPVNHCHAVEQQPLRQGQLDGLCGLYALINAARLAVPALPLRTCRRLFRDGAHWLYAKRAFPEVLYEGMTIGKLMGLHKAVIQSTVPGLCLKRPFARTPPASSAEFWEQLKAHAELPGHGVIVGIEGRRVSHWSVVYGITQAKVILFDSDGRAYLVRQKCSFTDAEEEAGTVITPKGISILAYTQRR